MTTKAEEARDNPSVSKVEIFDSLMTISSLSKALAKKVLLLSAENEKGGCANDTKALNTRSKC